MHNNIIRTTILALSAAAFISCVEVEDPQAGAVGYLSAPSLAVDVTIDDLLLTKALEFDVEAPSVDDIHFAVIDGTDNVRYECDGLWTDPIVLPVGEYTVEASAGENGFGEPYFTGSAPVSIQALGSSSPVIRLELANALVNVTVSDELKDHFIPGDKVILNPGAYEAPYGEWFYVPAGEDLTLSLAGCNSAGKEAVYEHKLARTAAKTAYSVICTLSSTNWPSISWTTSPADGAFEGAVYFKPVAVSGMSDENASELVYQIRGGDYADWTDAVVSDLDDTYKYISGLSDGTPYTLRACVGNIVSQEASFTPVRLEDCLKLSTVSASHNNADDPTEELSGTTMTCCGLKADLPSVIEELTKVTASGYFNSSDNKATGSFSAELSDQLQDMTFINADGWPYLPKGDYSVTVSAVCVLNGKDYTASANSAVTVPEPEFSVTLSAYTSYDKYAATNGIIKSIDDANECDPSTLYNAGAKWGISSDLMKNSNYKNKSISIYIDDKADGRTAEADSYDYNYLYQNVGSLSWESHTHRVEVTFDSKTETSVTATHHITGLPYTANPPSNDEQKTPHPWTEDQRGWGVVYFYWNDTEFITWNTSASGSTNIIGSPKFNVPDIIPIDISMMAHGHYKKVVIDYKYDVITKVHSGGQSVSITVDGSDLSYDKYTINSLSLTPSNPKIQIENTHVTGDNKRLYIQSVSVNYR